MIFAYADFVGAREICCGYDECIVVHAIIITGTVATEARILLGVHIRVPECSLLLGLTFCNGNEIKLFNFQFGTDSTES